MATLSVQARSAEQHGITDSQSKTLAYNGGRVCMCPHRRHTEAKDGFLCRGAHTWRFPTLLWPVSSAEPQTGHSGETQVQTLTSRPDKSLSPMTDSTSMSEDYMREGGGVDEAQMGHGSQGSWTRRPADAGPMGISLDGDLIADP